MTAPATEDAHGFFFGEDVLPGQLRKIRSTFVDFERFIAERVPENSRRAAAFQKLDEAQEACEQACFDEFRENI